MLTFILHKSMKSEIMKQVSSADSLREITEYEDAFEEMKKAAGVTDIDEIVERCGTQRKTASILEVQNNKAKADVMSLTSVKERLQDEWEVVR